MALLEDDDEALPSVDEHSLYESFWTWMLKLEHDASRGEIDDFQPRNQECSEMGIEKQEGEVKHTFVGMGFLEEVHEPSEDGGSSQWRFKLVGKPMQCVPQKSAVTISVSHPGRDALVYGKAVHGTIS